jgi:hypothetical protein
MDIVVDGARTASAAEPPGTAPDCRRLYVDASIAEPLSVVGLEKQHTWKQAGAAAQHAWTQDLEFRTDAARAVTVCFAAMDGANARLRDAFDKALRRLYMLAQNAGAAADAALATLTGDTVACDAFDVSPYVLSIVPEPIDYFMHCSDTADCRTRCFEEFRAFDAANRSVALGPVRQLDLETLVQMAARLQKAVSPPLVLDATQFYVTCSVGFCLPGRTPEPTGRALYEGAVVAADAAWQSGPGAIRSYSAEMGKVAADRDAERDMLETALDEGQIRAHFQPQVSTDTGEVTGFEALARWHHPERGLVAPGNFMPSLERAGLLEKLGVVLLHDALQAITRWDKSGLTVPRVSVNFSAEELRSPLLPPRPRPDSPRPQSSLPYSPRLTKSAPYPPHRYMSFMYVTTCSVRGEGW